MSLPLRILLSEGVKGAEMGEVSGWGKLKREQSLTLLMRFGAGREQAGITWIRLGPGLTTDGVWLRQRDCITNQCNYMMLDFYGPNCCHNLRSPIARFVSFQLSPW